MSDIKLGYLVIGSFLVISCFGAFSGIYFAGKQITKGAIHALKEADISNVTIIIE